MRDAMTGRQHQDGHAVALSPGQVHEVLRAAALSRVPSGSPQRGASIVGAPLSPNGDHELSEGDGAGSARGMLPSDSSDPRLSRSLLRGLSLLTCFDAEDEPRGIVDMANALGMSPSSAHRYARTLVHLGLLEHSPRTRKYSLPRAARAQNFLDRLSHATVD
jgi:IclR helix-turn-helix domain